MRNEITDIDDRLEPAPWDAWMRDVLREYRIPFDNTTQGLRSALCMWMAEHNKAIDPSSSSLWVRCGELEGRLAKVEDVVKRQSELLVKITKEN